MLPLFIYAALVDNTMTDLYADLIVNSMDGTQIGKRRVYLTGHSTQTVQLADILGGNTARVSYGSITIVPQDSLALMPILAQVSMVDESRRVPEYLESEPVMPEMFSTSLLEGVAVQSSRTPVVAITNVSGMERTVSISCLSDGGKMTPNGIIRVLGGATRMTRVCGRSDNPSGMADNPAQPKSVGILLSHNGKPGDILAFGYSSLEEGGDLVSVPFSDGGTSGSTAIAWPGVPVGFTRDLTPGGFQPVVAVANFSSRVIDGKIFLWRTEDGAPQADSVLPLHLLPNSTQTVTFPAYGGSESMENSFVLTHNGDPRNVAANLISVNESSGQIVQLVPKDPKQMENGGGHPWTIANGMDSTLLLFNPVAKQSTFTVNIPVADKKLWSKLYVLQPEETKSISLRELVDERAKDRKGVPLPGNLTGGEITCLNPDPGEGGARRTNR